MSDPVSINQLPDRTIIHNERQYLFFSGTAYLGLPQSLDFQSLLWKGIRQYGTVFGSSRNGNLRLGIYEEAEVKLAASVAGEASNMPAALTLSSGMIAGQVVVNWLRGEKSQFIYAPSAHPALWHDPAITLPTLSFADWVAQLPDQLQAAGPGPVTILTNALDAVGSSYYDFEWVSNLPDDRPITLVVDDSHGLGVLNNGQGIWPQIRLNRTDGPRIDGPRTGGSVRLLVTASLAKAMGMPGGVIFGDTETIHALRRTAFFGLVRPCHPLICMLTCGLMRSTPRAVRGFSKMCFWPRNSYFQLGCFAMLKAIRFSSLNRMIYMRTCLKKTF